jgi:hypothetical protein
MTPTTHHRIHPGFRALDIRRSLVFSVSIRSSTSLDPHGLDTRRRPKPLRTAGDIFIAEHAFKLSLE